MNNSIIDNKPAKLKRPFEAVGRLIVNQREGLGMNRAEMAVAINCGVPTISKWESGSVLPQGSNILALSELFGMSPANILMGLSCIETAENETVEQAELTNSTLLDISQREKGRAVDMFDKPSFNLTFKKGLLDSIRIEHNFHSIDLTVSDFPSLVIDAISEAVRRA